MNKKRISPVRSSIKAASGAGILIGALLALALLQSGPGLGDGDGKSDNDSETLASVAADTTTTSITQPESTEPNERAEEFNADERSAIESGQLTLLIDERDYLMQTQATLQPVYQPVKLDRAIELAGKTTGDTNGIRVIIQRRETARASAENHLRDRLRASGIDDNAIYMPGTFIP